MDYLPLKMLAQVAHQKLLKKEKREENLRILMIFVKE